MARLPRFIIPDQPQHVILRVMTAKKPFVLTRITCSF